MKTVTVRKAVEFIRSHNALKDWTDDEIAMLMYESIQQKSMAWSVDKRNEFDGIVLARVDREHKRLHIVTIVISNKGIMKRFVDMFNKYYYDYKLTGFRSNGKRLVDFSRKLSLLERF